MSLRCWFNSQVLVFEIHFFLDFYSGGGKIISTRVSLGGLTILQAAVGRIWDICISGIGK